MAGVASDSTKYLSVAQVLDGNGLVDHRGLPLFWPPLYSIILLMSLLTVWMFL
jgi:hypothetical protein